MEEPDNPFHCFDQENPLRRWDPNQGYGFVRDRFPALKNNWGDCITLLSIYFDYLPENDGTTRIVEVDLFKSGEWF